MSEKRSWIIKGRCMRTAGIDKWRKVPCDFPYSCDGCPYNIPLDLPEKVQFT